MSGGFAKIGPLAIVLMLGVFVAPLGETHTRAVEQVDCGNQLEGHRIEAGITASAWSAPQRVSSAALSQRVPLPG